MVVPDKYIKRVTSTIPFGYELSEIKGYLQPVEDQIDNLTLVVSMIKKKDGTPRKKGGRPKGSANELSYSNEQKAKVSAKKSILRKEKNIKKLEEKLNNSRKAYKKQKETLGKLDNDEDQVLTQDAIDELPDTIREKLNSSSVLFHPNDGPQTEFLAAGEKDVLYGGAAGGMPIRKIIGL